MTHRPPRRRRRSPASHAPSDLGPRPGETDDGEADAASDRPTVNPPFDVEAFAKASARSSPIPGRPYPSDTPTARPPPPDLSATDARDERVPRASEREIARAGAGSARRVDPPRYPTPSALSIANARAPSAPNVPAVKVPPSSAPKAQVAKRLTPRSVESGVLGAVGGPGPEITERTIEDPVAEMRERFSLGDYTGAFEMAELLLTEDPDDREAAECAEDCRGVLEGMYAARLGPLDRVPTVVVQRAQLRWLSMDHRAGFVLSLIDGSSTLDMILDVSGMPRLDAMRILHELLQQKIVSLKP